MTAADRKAKRKADMKRQIEQRAADKIREHELSKEEEEIAREREAYPPGGMEMQQQPAEDATTEGGTEEEELEGEEAREEESQEEEDGSVPATMITQVARCIMQTADTNANGELSFTELTSMLGGSPYQDFGKWLGSLGQAGASIVIVASI